MTTLTKIDNFQGIRITKPLIEQAHLENGLLIKPILTSRRENWKSNIEKVLLQNIDIENEAIINNLLNDSDLEDYLW